MIFELHRFDDYSVNKLFDAFFTFYTAFDVETAHALTKLSNLEFRDLPLRLQIVLVPYNDYILDGEFAVKVVLVYPLV